MIAVRLAVGFAVESRRRLALQRWLELLFAGVVAAAVVLILATLIDVSPAALSSLPTGILATALIGELTALGRLQSSRDSPGLAVSEVGRVLLVSANGAHPLSRSRRKLLIPSTERPTRRLV